MFSLLISQSGWSGSEDILGPDRVLEYTDDHLKEQLAPGGTPKFNELAKLPAVFASETPGSGNQLARVGSVFKASYLREGVKIRYVFDSSIPPIHNQELLRLADDLEIGSYEFRRTHWAVKDVDLFKVLYAAQAGGGPAPSVFSFEDLNRVEDDLVSAMMPFAAEFNEVYQSLKRLACELGLRCLRADDIWEHRKVVDDIVSLICRSKIVICDCTGKNANVFYEAGIADSIGKEVILITQSKDDIPFDLRHLRYVPYLNNGEGLQMLAAALRDRVAALAAV